MSSAADMTGVPLLCWDDSGAAASAIRGVAAILPAPRRATVVFAYDPRGGGVFSGAQSADAPRLTAEEADEAVRRGVQAAEAEGFEATGLAIPTKLAAEAIVQAADQRAASMLVLGQRERSRLSRALLGSIARDVVRDARQPVIVVGGPDDGPAEPAVPAEGPVLLCWDGSDGARQAMRDARAVLGSRRAIVLFAHVPTEAARGVLGGVSGPDAPIMGESDAEVLVDAGVHAAQQEGFDATPERVVADRKTADIIVALADEHDVPLIAMGQRQRSALGTLVLGSVARDVLATHHRPVLLGGPESQGVYPA